MRDPLMQCTNCGNDIMEDCECDHPSVNLAANQTLVRADVRSINLLECALWLQNEAARMEREAQQIADPRTGRARENLITASRQRRKWAAACESAAHSNHVI